MVVGATGRPEDILAAVVPEGALTRFAPAPTGFLHLGHVANAIHVWGLARAADGRVLLRIEDHDRQRCRPEFDAALLEDLSWLGFVPDLGPVRQSDADAPYAAALDRLLGSGSAYGCDCSRSTFRAWAAANGQPWSGPGCPGGCRARGLDGPVMRVSLGSGVESWVDGSLGSISTAVAPRGDLPVRDRLGNWTYGLCVVVDDLRQDIGLVVRGRDLLDATADQIRLARLLGRDDAPAFHHHPLILRPDGSKLSKSSGDTGVHALRAAGWSAADVRRAAGDATGWTADPT
jgi:glutamyl/glutaminyl-tRNA synthetase